MTDYYDEDGNPIGMWEWVVKIEASDMTGYSRVAETFIEGYVRVSTVWLGLNMNFSGIGPPLIFETMIFGLYDLSVGGEGADGEYQWRWATKEAALAGHDQAVAMAREAVAHRKR